MLKKLLFLTLPIAAIAVLTMQTASADYYDCYGNVRPGSPGPSECHYFTDPPAANQPQNVTPNQPYEPSITITPICSGNNCNNRPQEIQPTISPSIIITPLCNERNCDPQPQEIVPEPVDSSAYIRNTRKYCVRDYCYFIFEICYSDGHCEEKSERVRRDEYEHREVEPVCTDWRDCLNNYTYNYYYNYYYNNYYYNNDYNDDCRYRERNCVYRGTHYGRYHNGYWHF